MILKTAVPVAMIGISTLAACVAEQKPITIQDKCASAVASQAGIAVEAVRIEETIATAIGPKIYANANGTTYSCQGDLNGNISGVALET